ncbi:MAG: DUF4173 domain-containing protein [Lachnospiraceae bacterium]|nr:DUF4173 domain-containing protein [Lachnospiraceae bacterium]
MENNEKYSKTLRAAHQFVWKACIIHAVLYSIFAYRAEDGLGAGIFEIISVCVFLIVAFKLKKEAVPEDCLAISIGPGTYFYYLADILITFSSAFTNNKFFIIMNGIIGLLLFSIATIKIFYNDKYWGFYNYFAAIVSFFIGVIASIPVPFYNSSLIKKRRAAEGITKKARKKMSPTTKNILTGVIVALPIFFIILGLLASADKVFGDVMTGIFDFVDYINVDWLLENYILFPYMFIIYFAVVYLVFAALTDKKVSNRVYTPTKFETTIAVVVYVMVDLLYVIFSIVQFMYLFQGKVPEGYSYAEYARQGFFQLLFVAIINYSGIVFTNAHYEKNALLKLLMTITCLATYVLIASSAFRMVLYIRVYNLTLLRVLVLWFLGVLSIFMIGCLVSVYFSKWNLFKYSIVVFTFCYAILCFAGVDNLIVKYNFDSFREDYSHDESVSLLDYIPDEYRSNYSYAIELANVYNEYSLSETDKLLVEKYFVKNARDFYNIRDYQRGRAESIEIKKEYRIYTPKKITSPMNYKRYNFAAADFVRALESTDIELTDPRMAP